MIDLKLLSKHGTTNERLREVFRARVLPELKERPPGESAAERKERKQRLAAIESDIVVRQKLEKRIQSRIEEGIDFSLRQWRIFAAVDLAFDSTIISKMSIPLLMYAQGKINVERCVSLLKESPNGKQYIIPGDGKDKKESVDVSRFVEAEINLVRSVVMRRWAAQKTKYNQLYPYYKVESRSTGLVGKLRADLVSQRMDIMCDQFGYRRHDSQAMLGGLLYGHVVDFQRCAWEVESAWRAKPDGSPESYVKREGLTWFTPHPSRVYYDTNYPLSSINSDSGCEFLGFWDVMRYSDIENNPDFFNKDVIGFGNKFWGDGGIHNIYREYFTQYSYTLIAPRTGEEDPAKANDRKATVGFYSGTQGDASVFVTNHYEKIIPKDYNIGEYPFPVWTRFVVASNNTIMAAEFLPSRPGAVLSINESDSRLSNVSMAMDVLQFQQHMTNLVCHLLSLLQIESFKAIGINTDALEKAQVESIRKQLMAEDWSSRPLVYEYSFVKMKERLQEMGVNAAIKDIVSVSETRVAASISTVFEAMIKLMTLVERLVSMSPAENGQPAPREISATEVTEIANTTSSVYSSISDDIDEFREAKKIIIYESLVTCSKAELNLPVKGRYSAKTVAAAGLSIVEGEDEDFAGDTKRRTITGSVKKLEHNFIFSSRDGSERPVNTQAANTMVQLVGQVLAVPAVAQKVGKEKLYEIFNEIFRMSGAGIDLNLELSEGEDNSLGEDQIKQLSDVVMQIQKFLQQLAGQTQKNSQDISSQQEVNDQQQQTIESLTKLAEQVRVIAEKQASMDASRIPEITYKDAPPEIQAQIELRSGFAPAKARPDKASAKKLPAVKP